jgi:hypothetical protein
MTSNLITLLIGTAAALGLASTATLAQQADAPSRDENSQMMHSGDMSNGNMMAMMKDPQMRGEMMAMMKNCKKMMERMDTMSSSQERPNRPHQKR